MGAKMVPPATHFRVRLGDGSVEDVYALTVEEAADDWIFMNGSVVVKKFPKSEVVSFVAD